ncbi:Imm71 family immunity protein, partial [Xanthomonas fragariae]
SHFIQLIWRIEIGENGIDEALTPLWDEFSECLEKMRHLGNEIWADIIEGRYFEDPAPNVYGKWFVENVSKMHFP